MKNITANTEIIREANGGAKIYHCTFCNNYDSRSYWNMYAHALRCSYCNNAAYRMGWNTVFALLKKAVGI